MIYDISSIYSWPARNEAWGDSGYCVPMDCSECGGVAEGQRT